ncbi:DsbC family protein [Ottowia sp.]|uniref:DsbC family protein n=1 Tax=Ottowia sp. TaxID=1898956 RepID=UPI0025DFE6CD|nr:DsbC family protein [Ottowia sp.]MBK6616131.1 DsbC family protein [Ottowia sp.]
MNFKNIIAAVAVLVGATASFAQPSGLAQTASVANVSLTPEALLAKLKATYVNTPFAEVRTTPIAGIYEVTMGKDVAYTDASGNFFMFGNVMDMRTQRNITQERRAELTKVDVGQLNLADAIKTVRGDGSRVLYVFSDPECTYCKRLEPTLQELKNVTIYTFLYPVLGEKSNASAKSVWCAKDRNKAWADHMLKGVAGAAADCDNPIQRNVTIGSSFGITGTPTLVSATGRVQPGAVPAERIEALLAEAPVSTAKGK